MRLPAPAAAIASTTSTWTALVSCISSIRMWRNIRAWAARSSGNSRIKPAPLEEQVVVVHAVGRALALGVGRGGRLDLRLPLDQLGVALGDDLRRGAG